MERLTKLARETRLADEEVLFPLEGASDCKRGWPPISVSKTLNANPRGGGEILSRALKDGVNDTRLPWFEAPPKYTPRFPDPFQGSDLGSVRENGEGSDSSTETIELLIPNLKGCFEYLPLEERSSSSCCIGTGEHPPTGRGVRLFAAGANALVESDVLEGVKIVGVNGALPSMR